MIIGVAEGFRTMECGEVKLTIVYPREHAQEALKLWNERVATMTVDEAWKLEEGKCKCGGECHEEVG